MKVLVSGGKKKPQDEHANYHYLFQHFQMS